MNIYLYNIYDIYIMYLFIIYENIYENIEKISI